MSKIISTFVPAMKLDLYINEANDYARDIRVPVLHPHVAIIHYDEAGEIRHSLNRINCYGIFLQREFPENMTYGIEFLPLRRDTAFTYADLQLNEEQDHRDPSDHIIIAHAITERLTLLSSDQKFAFYRSQGLDLIEY